MSTQPPAIYLDHWALRKMAEQQEWRERFLTAFKARGTLYFSTANLAELAGNNDASLASVKSFLEAVGPHWPAMNIDPFEVMKREASWKPGDKAPYVADFFFKQGDFLKRLTTGSISLAHLVDMLGPAERDALISKAEELCSTVVVSLTKARAAYKKDLAFLDQFPDSSYSDTAPTKYVCMQLMRMFIKDSFALNTNHIRDFFHAAVAVAHANMVVLDKHWHAQVEKLKMPPQRVRVFRESTMAEFFEVLETQQAIR